MFYRSLIIALLGFTLIPSALGEVEVQHLDAPEQTRCQFQDHATVTVESVRIQRNGRKIIGNVVPDGKTLQTGDKRSTQFVTNTNLVVGGKDVPAGHYALTTTPNAHNWTMVLRKAPGKGSRKQFDEVGGIDLLVKKLPSILDSFTIAFDQYQGGCVLNIRWKQTEASVLVAEKK